MAWRLQICIFKQRKQSHLHCTEPLKNRKSLFSEETTRNDSLITNGRHVAPRNRNAPSKSLLRPHGRNDERIATCASYVSSGRQKFCHVFEYVLTAEAE